MYLDWPDARMDSVGSNDMQQSDMNHTHTLQHTHRACCAAATLSEDWRHNLWGKESELKSLEDVVRVKRVISNSRIDIGPSNVRITFDVWPGSASGGWGSTL